MSTSDDKSIGSKKSLGLPSFRKKKTSSGSVASAPAASGTKTSGTKKLKRIRGLLTGVSRRERKAKKEAEREAAIAAGNTPVATSEVDEDETVYGVDVENSSIANTVEEKKSLLGGAVSDEEEKSVSTSQALQVILLLMDPKTRRFELLQLEFDSNKAVVRDVLSQVPHSVTEEALRQQNYTGVCDRTGQELYYSTRLADVCNGSDILIALPSTVEARECARLARPILQDRNVIEMLRASGVDVTSLEKKEAPPSPKKAAVVAPVVAPPAPVVVAPPAPTPKSPPRVAKAPAAVAAAARAISPVKPKAVSKSRAAPAAPIAPPPPPVAQEEEKKNNTLFIILLVGVAILIQVVHMSVTAPLNPGHTLSPGAFMSKCGYKSFLPICDEQSLVMQDDGVLTLYGSDGAVEWEMIGSVCRDHDSRCKNGLVVYGDGTLEIGGKRVNAAAIYGEAVFTPWPFTFSPNIRLVKGRR
mmetsp:Transcript_5445/g.8945  ORF Transcript_5445/g.8945 Transcript_5445/m.8945 type:complete len:471 (-) Transcript_5445:330-1742(-)|eukprot:CAMPEP_0119025976 /NCGR_PEP_ID=MMETSP1176-20130426/34640_1 /TAXON_ID=265551 /ORGANISM="Synedropsis recta cf, Strain CCMP1620" /LENGTH=470 /DNA_ID=CAMNT_0006981603 /DNA_START=111 /DNA_END=1523 /DNA_ORIENTATION=+